MDQHDEAATAHAFWIREPGVGELRERGAARPPARTRCWCGPATPGSAGAPRRWCSAAGCRRASTRRCGPRSRTASSPARSSTATSTSAGSSAGRPSWSTARCSACTRTRTATWCRRPRSPSSRPRCRPGGRCWPGAVETAVNALWDAGPLVGDRIAVIGAGMVGCCVARLLAGLPAARVQLVDADPARERVAAALGVAFRDPGGGRRRLRPGAARQREPGRADQGAAAGRRRGHGGRAELVRRPGRSRCRSGRPSTPAG